MAVTLRVRIATCVTKHNLEGTGLTGSRHLLRREGFDSSDNVLTGSGEMGERIRALDWGLTPIGPTESWSPTLQMIVGLLVANRLPLLLWWGPDYISIYNDAYRSVLGKKHPLALGKPCREVFPEIWHILKPLIDTPFTGGPASWMEDLSVELNRHGFIDEAHFTIAYSPVPDNTAPRGIGGVLAMGHEITEKIVSERRVEALRDLATRAGEAKTAEEAASLAVAALGPYAADIPFAALYLFDERLEIARLAATTGVEPKEPAAPLALFAGSGGKADQPWPVADVLRSGSIIVVEDLAERLQKVPSGPWSDPPHTAVVVPIKSNTALQLAGIFVVGVSPRLKLDKQYHSFFELLGSQLASIIATARAYEEERKRAEALAEIDRAKTLFFSNVSHEFRTPLTLMLGPLEDSLAAPLPEQQRGRLEVAHRNSLRLLKLVNSLLDFSRIEAGRAQASYEAVDLSAFTAELASNFRSACERAGLLLIVDCPTLPELAYVDRDLWEKIVLNLLSNAFKFTFEGQIAVRLRAVNGSATLSIEDTGVGIPEAELPRLFERFHRIEGQRSRTYEGSGIGLALVQELVKLHHGNIRVESKPERGTTFAVSVPFGRVHLPADRIGTTPSLASTSVRAEAYVQEALRWLPDAPQSDDGLSPQAAGTAPLDHGVRVLVADDNADMRAYLCHLLDPNCEVEAVADGDSALEAIHRRRPDLLITDVMMPGLHGFELVRAIRNDPELRELPIIMLSARAGEESRVEGLETGADDYLAKPFSARELIARVRANLKLAQVRQQGTEALRESERRYRELIDALPAAVYTTDLEGHITYFNQAAIDLAGRRAIPGKDRWCAMLTLYRSDGALLRHDRYPLEVALREGRPVGGEEVMAERPDGARVSLIAYATPIHDRAGTLIGAVNVLLDISERKQAEERLRRNEAWLSGQKEAFQTAMDGGPLAKSLGILIRTAIEQAGDERRCAFYIADDSGGLRHVVGMPDSYAGAVNSFGPEALAYNLAVGTGRPVITPDVRDEPRWKPWLPLAEEYGYCGCWSFPVETVTGKIVGSLAMYLNEPRDATSRDRELAAALTQAAAIIISRHQEAEERERVDRVRAETEAALRKSEEQLRAYLAASFDVVYWMSADWTVMRRLEGKEVMSDTTEPNSMWLDKYVHPDDQAHVMETIQQAIRTKSVFELEHRVLLADGTLGWALSRAAPLLDENGEIVEWLGTAADVTARKRYDERQNLLVNELNHRVKNTLASVQSIAMQTLRDAPTKAEGWRALQARLLALASAHDVLTRGHWEGADIYEVIQGSLAAYRMNGQDTRLKLTGPNIRLRPRAALALSLAVHELATNAGKYGALSIDSGRVDVDWTIATEPPVFSLRWAESGGPPVKMPQRRGFGSRLIERGLAQDLDGDIRLDFEPSGVICTIAAPMEGVIKGQDGPL